MKIASLNTRDAANIPRPLTLHDAFDQTQEALGADGKPMVLWLYGMQSDRARNAQRERERKHGNRKNLTDEQTARIGAEFLAAITQGWSDNWVDDDGKKIEYSPETAIQVYLCNDGLARQVMSFTAEIENYDPKRWSA